MMKTMFVQHLLSFASRLSSVSCTLPDTTGVIVLSLCLSKETEAGCVYEIRISFMIAFSFSASECLSLACLLLSVYSSLWWSTSPDVGDGGHDEYLGGLSVNRGENVEALTSSVLPRRTALVLECQLVYLQLLSSLPLSPVAFNTAR